MNFIIGIAATFKKAVWGQAPVVPAWCQLVQGRCSQGEIAVLNKHITVCTGIIFTVLQTDQDYLSSAFSFDAFLRV